MDDDGQIEVRFADPAVRDAVGTIARAADAIGGRVLLVGGCVRDADLGRTASDVDLEVYGVPARRLVEVLSRRFSFDRVGRAFAILKLRGIPIDVSIPRRDSLAGAMRGDIEATSDPELPLEVAAARRDFTVNAIAVDALTGACLDPFHGRADLRAGILRHTSEHFGEDPLRVLRGMQLVARFELTAHPTTLALCRTLSPANLPRERVFEEWRKLVVYGRRPSVGLSFLRDCGWLAHYPELAALEGCLQDPEWHPEGDVFVHTLHAMDAFARERLDDAGEDLVVGLAVLCHDLGKPETTRFEDGRITSKGHEQAGVEHTRDLLTRMTPNQRLAEEVLPLVADHLKPQQLFDAGAGDAAVRRLARRVGRIDRLVRVARADQRGRPPIAVPRFAAGDWLLERARALAVERRAPRPIVRGQHLLALGVSPGPRLGVILDDCYAAQIEGSITTLEGGIELARQLIERDEDPAGD
jgi:tRNA nucleotidyltransferase (CCA-adding enzyme)